MTRPPSIQRLYDLIRGETSQPLRDDLYRQAGDERERLKRGAQDQAIEALPWQEQIQHNAANAYDRSTYDANNAYGPTKQWAPFFEAMAGQRLNTGSIALPEGPGKDLPAGYTEGRYGGELDAYAHGGKAPGFFEGTPLDTTAGRAQRELAPLMPRRAASMAALAKTRGY